MPDLGKRIDGSRLEVNILHFYLNRGPFLAHTLTRLNFSKMKKQGYRACERGRGIAQAYGMPAEPFDLSLGNAAQVHVALDYRRGVFDF